ncbi:luciferase family protein [Niveispirillum sp. KHB5.9]|uniref:luciferase domain-containing protein n=1 Tax=Niveispirillum sp. KHB5.9 TaxID=3400269 RepID=UPI003A87E49E
METVDTFEGILPARYGPRPQTIPRAPHSQIDQIPPDRRQLGQALLTMLSTLPGVETGSSMRAPPGTIGLYLRQGPAATRPRAFLLGHEFAHVHLEDDGSLHTVLPEPLRSRAIAAGWAEPHPLAGYPTVSPDTVMIYAPRNQEEVSTVARLVRHAHANASGTTGTGPAF